MLLALPLLSFSLLFILSAVFLPTQAIRSNVSTFCLMIWLCVCLVITGVNSLAWRNDTEAYAMVWCDIVTKILLGSFLALPAVSLSWALELESIGSRRAIMPKSRIIVPVVLCGCLPIVYMLLHIVFQVNRFELVQSYGPFASILPASISVVVLWLPPFMLCVASLVCTGIAIHHTTSRSHAEFSSHIYTRTTQTISSGQYHRRAVMNMLMASAQGMYFVFLLVTAPAYVDSTGWARDLPKIVILDSELDAEKVLNKKFAAWFVPSIAVVYVVCAVLLGDEGREIVKFLRSWTWTPPSCVGEWLHKVRSCHVKLPLHRTKPSNGSLHPFDLPSAQLTSGWDDTLDSKGSKRGYKLRHPLPRLQTSIISRLSGTPSSPSDSQHNADAAFANATMQYVTSPVGRSLTTPAPIVHRHEEEDDDVSSFSWVDWPSPPKPVYTHAVSRHDSLLLSPTTV